MVCQGEPSLRSLKREGPLRSAMSAVLILSFALPLVLVVVGLAYLLEIRNPLRNWIPTVAVCFPVAVLVTLFVYQG